jgi:hypothetical protein
MLKIGTLVLYKDDDEPCLGVVIGDIKPLTDVEETLMDFYRERGTACEVYPVKWGDMTSICDEQPENLIIVSEVE